MTQEDKELLLKDLCARLPYGVKLKIGEYSDYKLIGIIITDEFPIKVEVIENDIPYRVEVSLDIIKPYLRPMSSMTKEEKEEYDSKRKHICDEYNRYCFDTVESIDWLNKHHFDYRTTYDESKEKWVSMIEKGLVIEVTEENNPYK
jgi:hypothetical protein